MKPTSKNSSQEATHTATLLHVPMGAALSLSGFRRPRPEPDDPSSSDEEPPDAKRVKSAPYVLTVLQSSESVTKVLAYTGCGCVLTLETLSATTHATIRGLSLEFEVPTKGRRAANRADPRGPRGAVRPAAGGHAPEKSPFLQHHLLRANL